MSDEERSLVRKHPDHHGLAVGRKLAELRHERGLTQEFVAQAAGISCNHYQLLEYGLGKRGERKPANPRLSTLVALSHVLGTTVPDLIGAMFSSGQSMDAPSPPQSDPVRPDAAAVDRPPGSG